MSMSITQWINGFTELKQLEASGVKLPFRPMFILRQEARGHVVDLTTGAITLNGAQARHSATGRGAEVARG